MNTHVVRIYMGRERERERERERDFAAAAAAAASIVRINQSLVVVVYSFIIRSYNSSSVIIDIYNIEFNINYEKFNLVIYDIYLVGFCRNFFSASATK